MISSCVDWQWLLGCDTRSFVLFLKTEHWRQKISHVERNEYDDAKKLLKAMVKVAGTEEMEMRACIYVIG